MRCYLLIFKRLIIWREHDTQFWFPCFSNSFSMRFKFNFHANIDSKQSFIDITNKRPSSLSDKTKRCQNSNSTHNFTRDQKKNHQNPWLRFQASPLKLLQSTSWPSSWRWTSPSSPPTCSGGRGSPWRPRAGASSRPLRTLKNAADPRRQANRQQTDQKKSQYNVGFYLYNTCFQKVSFAYQVCLLFIVKKYNVVFSKAYYVYSVKLISNWSAGLYMYTKLGLASAQRKSESAS